MKIISKNKRVEIDTNYKSGYKFTIVIHPPISQKNVETGLYEKIVDEYFSIIALPNDRETGIDYLPLGSYKTENRCDELINLLNKADMDEFHMPEE